MNGLIPDTKDASNGGQMRALFGISKTICNTLSKSSPAVWRKDVQLITEQNEVLERWNQHFEETLNREQPTNPVIIHEEKCHPVLTANWNTDGTNNQKRNQDSNKANEKWKISWHGQYSCGVVKIGYGNCRDKIGRLVRSNLKYWNDSWWLELRNNSENTKEKR